jgi:hypothetical protein
MIAPLAHLEVHTLLALDNADKLTGHNPALMYELVEAVLAIGAWLSKINLACLKTQPCAIQSNSLAVAFHRHLFAASRNNTYISKRHSIGGFKLAPRSLERITAASDLLNVRSKLGESLSVGQNGQRRVAQECRIPDAHETQQHRDVVIEGRSAKMFIHIISSCI